MKLRIRNNSLRLRVSRSELARLGNGETVAAAIQFGAAATDRLHYALHVDHGNAAEATTPLTVHFAAGAIDVSVTPAALALWQADDQVGVYVTLDNGTAGGLEVTVEKDFACLDRSHEENADAFVNPHAALTC